VVGPIVGVVAGSARAGAPEADAPQRSPGMLERHYSPEAELVVFRDDAAATAAVERARAAGRKVGAVVLQRSPLEVDEVVALPADARGYARLFYAALHTLDEAGCGLVLVEQVPETAAWDGVRDRLRRAGGARLR
jgi:L-threonylcarbamoyladenylate synthase